jgi:predicted DNA-binding transcriptional regulator
MLHKKDKIKKLKKGLSQMFAFKNRFLIYTFWVTFCTEQVRIFEIRINFSIFYLLHDLYQEEKNHLSEEPFIIYWTQKPDLA